jgi:zinc/manganese transport system substrate-binding protein/manganese/iron transport system substrate-binding protein
VRALFLIAAVSAAALAGCSSDTGNDGGNLRVVATTTQAADLARQVAGDRAEVTQLLQPGADPHDYEPRPSDARALTGAQVVIRSGGEVDDWLGDLAERSGSDARTLTLIDTVRRDGDDPHWWQDPGNGQLAVAAIRDALAEADPSGARTYRRNARAYGEGLIRLDAAIARCVDRLPPERRKLVTSHDSLGYYARRYGFEVVGAAIPSLSSQAQPSGASTERLIRQIREQRVPAIFPESALDAKLERAIAREADASVAPALWADALGPEGSAGATYAGSLAANTRTIVEALGEGRVNCSLEP